MEKQSYRHSLSFEGGPESRRVVLSPADFKMKGEALENWEGLDIALALSGEVSWEDLRLKNLRWLQE